MEVSDLSGVDQRKETCAGTAFPDDIKLIQTLGFGCVMVIEALWERLGIGKTLRDLCKANRLEVAYERALLVMTPTGFTRLNPNWAYGIDGCRKCMCLPVTV
jgi:hypothetical protein